MITEEIFALEAVRDVLREQMKLTPQQCDCEIDEQVPAIVGDLYLAVMPAGIAAGPKHNASGGVQDSVFSVTVSVIQRAVTAKDRRRSIFLDRLDGVNRTLDQVVTAIDWQPSVMRTANQLMRQFDPAAQQFIELFRVARVDPKPRMMNSEIFGAAHKPHAGVTPYVAMARSVTFSGLRRVSIIQYA